MEVIKNTFNAVGYALEMFTNSVYFIVDLIGYLPAILGSAVIVFLTAYIIRFVLLK